MLVLSLALALAPPVPQSFGREQILTSVNAFRKGVVAADLDQDGDLDLLTASWGEGQVAWLENSGDGQFPLLRGIEGRLPENSQPSSVAVGDINGDGILDVVVTAPQFSANNANAWYPGLGAGQFGSRVLLPAQGVTSAIQVADLDRDGDQDLAFIDRDAGVSWTENLGSGTFAASVNLTPGNAGNRSLIIADLDGDGTDDLVWCDGSARRVRWIKSLGAGAFAAAESIGAEIISPSSLVAEDFDQDGDRDLLVGATDEVLRIENMGGGQFLDRTLVATTGGGRVTIAVGDADGDLDLDLFATGSSATTIRYYENVGGGGFAQRSIFGALPTDSAALLVADLDGDGDVDPIHAKDDIVWFESQGGGRFGPPQTATRSTPASPFDFDGDGDLDLLGVRLDAVVASGNLGDGIFGRPIALATGLPGAENVVALDVGLDGDMDLVVASLQNNQTVALHLVERTPAGLQPPALIYQAQAQLNVKVTVVDQDQDGHPDLVLQYSAEVNPPDERVVWIRNALGMPLTPTAPQATIGYGINRWEDVDGDGDSDYLTLGATPSSQLLLYRNQGDGALDPVVILAGFGAADGRPFVTGDVDGDGDQDIVFHRGANSSLNWCENLGAGTFAPRAFLRTIPVGTYDMVAADVDLDDDDDVLLWAAGGGSFIESLGGASFGPTLDLPNARWFRWSRNAVAVDLDGDSDLDLVRSAQDLTSIQLNEHSFGTRYCDPAVPNSTGRASTIGAAGSAAIQTNAMSLTAVSLPPGSFGYFLVSDRTGLVAMPGGSQGTLCILGPIGRLNRGPAEIFQAGASGSVEVPIDLTDIPTPTGSSSVMPGDTRFFQGWYRDANPTPTSNFTNGLQVQFRLR